MEAIELTCDCRRPQVFRSDYVAEGVQYINRHCNCCGKHFHGPAANITTYTRTEWDRYLEAAS
jgi:hypothetical protein